MVIDEEFIGQENELATSGWLVWLPVFFLVEITGLVLCMTENAILVDVRAIYGVKAADLAYRRVSAWNC